MKCQRIGDENVEQQHKLLIDRISKRIGGYPTTKNTNGYYNKRKDSRKTRLKKRIRAREEQITAARTKQHEQDKYAFFLFFFIPRRIGKIIALSLPHFRAYSFKLTTLPSSKIVSRRSRGSSRTGRCCHGRMSMLTRPDPREEQVRWR